MGEGWSRDIPTEVIARLDTLGQVAAGLADPVVDPERVRAELGELVKTWRHLLELHSPDERNGRCPRCSTWRRRDVWPCAVWRSAHQALLTRGDVPPPGTQQ